VIVPVIEREFFEDVSVWPVSLGLPSADGYTLWGDSGRGDDLLLAVGNRLVLADDVESLTRWIVGHSDTGYAGRPGYAKLQGALRRGGLLDAAGIDRFELASVPIWLRQDPARRGRDGLAG
jgi:hypothetical protein